MILPPPCSLLEAASCGDVKYVTIFLESMENTDASGLLEVDKKGYSAAAWACCQDDLPILCLLLAASPTYLTLCTHNGASLLHLASLHKSLRCLQHLLVLAQNTPLLLNATNDFQETPLHLAAGIGHTETTKELLQAGAACLMLDQYGRSPSTVSVRTK
jgi:ankyrin repeat protein